MWVHLLTLRLVKGASPVDTPPEPPPPSQTGSGGGGGGGRALRELIERAFKKEPEAVEELVEVVRELPAPARTTTLREALRDDPRIPLLAKQEKLIEQLLKALREREEEEEIVVQLLLT